jgi:hypothetical protein
MKFTTGHQRSLAGSNVSVDIECEGGEEINHVKVELDGSALVDEEVEPASEKYENEFTNAGDAGPLVEHQLVITATTSDGKEHSSTILWTDPV